MPLNGDGIRSESDGIWSMDVSERPAASSERPKDYRHSAMTASTNVNGKGPLPETLVSDAKRASNDKINPNHSCTANKFVRLNESNIVAAAAGWRRRQKHRN